MDYKKQNLTKAGLKITYRQIEDLKPYAANARIHSKTQLRQIADSITTFGFTNPILLDNDNTIIAGHGRLEAAKQLGISEVPTIQLSHLTEPQKRAYIIADNRLAEKAGWDKFILAIEFQQLMQLDPAFDLNLTGFEMPEIDIMIQGLGDVDEKDEDTVSPIPKQPVSREGDLWVLGDHRVYCGNSLEKESYDRLLNGKKVHMVFTDPPYNVPIQGHVSGRGKVRHEEFAMASGEMTPERFTGFLNEVFKNMVASSLDGALHFVCMDWRHMGELLKAGKDVYSELKNLCVWNKDRGGMGALYRSKHELVFLFKTGAASHTNNIELGKHGRYRTNVWDYPAVNSRDTGPNSELAMHPTVKPVRMIADALMDCSNSGDLVLDPFGGSGSTLMAAERTGRTAFLIELSPGYVDTILLRWKRKSGKEATHAESEKNFSQLKKERSSDHDRV